MRGVAGRAPRTTLRTETALPGWVLRAALLLVTVLAGLAAGAADPAQWGVVGGLALLVALRPHGTLTALAVGVLAAMSVLTDAAALWQLPVLLLSTHLLLALGPLADVSPWRARVEVAVLRDALAPFLAVQALAQVAGVVAAALRGAAPVPWFVVVALAGLGVVTWLLIRQLSRPALPPSSAASLERRRRRYPL